MVPIVHVKRVFGKVLSSDSLCWDCFDFVSKLYIGRTCGIPWAPDAMDT